MWNFDLARHLLLAAACAAWSCAIAQAIELRLPIDCEIGRSCEVQSYVDLDPSPGVRDHQCGTRTNNGHNGTDFRVSSARMQRAGVNVLAAAAGRVLRVRDGVPDLSFRERELAAVDGRKCGNGVIIDHNDGWTTQYCHMAQGSVMVKPGDVVEVAQPLGRVGLSGLTEYPHLHFGVALQGRVVDPFAFEASEESCGGGRSLWEPSLQGALAYKPRAVLNAGFANGPVEMAAIENEELTTPTRDTALVAYARAIGAKGGDVQRLAITGPDGRILVDNRAAPLDRDKAQVMVFAGKKPPVGGWAPGNYQATYTISADGKVVLERVVTTTLQ